MNKDFFNKLKNRTYSFRFIRNAGIAAITFVAVLIGAQGRQIITADEIAKKLSTINYEIVTRINPVLPRLVRA